MCVSAHAFSRFCGEWKPKSCMDAVTLGVQMLFDRQFKEKGKAAGFPGGTAVAGTYPCRSVLAGAAGAAAVDESSVLNCLGDESRSWVPKAPKALHENEDFG
eukprot:TRINITY_DN29062_c0_g2_i1.p3 TRINITY_DN29062_c0_g2~~TRINITY_DN29062_c0_g2_i1.p3  ORF type:complete len:102 (-),score=5.13 TRINITY_DN29062_c0_g2_i1:333-638(-)